MIKSDAPSHTVFPGHSRIVGVTEGRVRRLSGFQKNHHLPDGHHPAAQAFIRRIGHEAVKSLADRLYADLRTAFGYKRREFSYTCEDGFACIKTPDFELQLRIDQCQRNAKNYQLTTEIIALHNPTIGNDARFHLCFSHHCDTLVVDFPGSIALEEKIDALEAIPAIEDCLDYEPDGSAIELKLPELDLQIDITAEQMTFRLLSLRNLGKLLEHSQKAFDILATAGRPAAGLSGPPDAASTT